MNTLLSLLITPLTVFDITQHSILTLSFLCFYNIIIFCFFSSFLTSASVFPFLTLLSLSPLLFFGICCFFVFLFMAAPVAYGSSQARGWISCSCRPVPKPQQRQIFNPLSKARDQTCVLQDTSQILNRLSHNRNSYLLILKKCFWSINRLFISRSSPVTQWAKDLALSWPWLRFDP